MEQPIFSALKVEIEDRLARITLNRPERLNALSVSMLEEIIELAAWLNTRDDLRVVVLSGAGRSFCAGFDLENFSRSGDGASDRNISSRHSAELGRLATDAWTDIKQISVVAVQGHCVGGGVVLVGACDIRLAAIDAMFSVPEVDLGIPLAWGGIPRLVREIGPALTKELVLTCRPFTASEAQSMGFINRVVGAEELSSQVENLAFSLASKPLYALRTTKAQVNAVMEEIAGTGRSASDADALVYAMHDPESRAASARYLFQRRTLDTR
jgi:enoyl-CoA hydratase/carnithine racemase